MRFLHTLCALVAYLTLTPIAGASPLFSLDTQADWQTALNNGTVTAVNSHYAALDHYGNIGVDYVLRTPLLNAVANAQSGLGPLGDGLQMSWGDANEPLPEVAAWEYTYGADPDLTNTLLRLTVTPPPGIATVSLTLTDLAGGFMSWFWDVNPPGPGPSGFPAGASSTISIDPTLHANQSNSSFFSDGGFNHTIAISIIADERASPGAATTSFPAAPITTGAPIWNYWSALSVTRVAEPTSLLLLGAALAVLGVGRRRGG